LLLPANSRAASEFAAIEEMIERGESLVEGELRWYRLYRTGGRRLLRQHMQVTPTSTTYELYPDYYGQMFDDLRADHIKRCGSVNARCASGVERNSDWMCLCCMRGLSGLDASSQKERPISCLPGGCRYRGNE
jgi:hypothetical protein